MTFDEVRKVADAVLFEGYALYPYRPTSMKNQLRFQFGVLAPEAYSQATRSDPWRSQTEVLISGDKTPEITGCVRFLRLRRRRLFAPGGDPVASFEVDGQLVLPWDEGEMVELSFAHRLDLAQEELAFELDASEEREPLRTEAGSLVGEAKNTRARLSLRLIVSVERQPTSQGCWRLTLRLANVTVVDPTLRERDQALLFSPVGCHLLLGVDRGAFVSLLEPPAWATQAASGCRNVGCYPVLVGNPARQDQVLSAPIILYDYPQVAPESPGDLFDATEIDEILTLRTRLLTDAEKREARAIDPRVAALIDRVDNLSPEEMARMHGVLREVNRT